MIGVALWLSSAYTSSIVTQIRNSYPRVCPPMMHHHSAQILPDPESRTILNSMVGRRRVRWRAGRSIPPGSAVHMASPVAGWTACVSSQFVACHGGVRSTKLTTSKFANDGRRFARFSSDFIRQTSCSCFFWVLGAQHDFSILRGTPFFPFFPAPF